MLERLSVKRDKIVNAKGGAVRLRGVGVGGWMNMENFINGYPGAEEGLRVALRQVLGAERAGFFFDRWLDYVLAEADLKFIRSCGANVVRLPLNYRHFESDETPFSYSQPGFDRLERVLGWCEKNGLYAILDLHAAQGSQNPDWHSDNANRQALFWQHPHFQDRFVALWEEFARRFKSRGVIAGYNVMNEPVTGARRGRFSHAYTPDWTSLNRVNRRVVEAVRKIDPETIIFLEGDCFSTLFDGLEPPFADNLAYSSHNYTPAGFGPGSYLGMCKGEHWDMQKQRDAFDAHQGTQFARKHRVPLWVGEFGCVSNGRADERASRLASVDDHIRVIEESGAHWTLWTYKDIGVMGWVELDAESEFMRLTASLRSAKERLGTDYWMPWLEPTPAKQIVAQLADEIERVVGRESLDADGNQLFLSQATLDVYVGALLQPVFAKLFTGMNEAEIDKVLRSFAFEQCRVREDLMAVLRKFLQSPKG